MFSVAPGLTWVKDSNTSTSLGRDDCTKLAEGKRVIRWPGRAYRALYSLHCYGPNWSLIPQRTSRNQFRTMNMKGAWIFVYQCNSERWECWFWCGENGLHRLENPGRTVQLKRMQKGQYTSYIIACRQLLYYSVFSVLVSAQPLCPAGCVNVTVVSLWGTFLIANVDKRHICDRVGILGRTNGRMLRWTFKMQI